MTSKDVHLSVDEGYDSIELSKRYTTVTMGPCQGRMCQLPSVRLMAQETGQTLDEVGLTTARPPWVSVPMGILGGRPVEPAKRSSIHNRHRELGATVKWAGDWRRAYDYGDPEGEALAVNRAAGLIDVSTLGKLIVRGPDAGEFLDRLYPNRFSNLKPGRIRYGVISSDAGRIVDDGTICRIDDETFYVTTTSSGAGAVEEWFGWWQATWGDRVHLTDVTQGLSAVNLAGPRAREIMGAVTDLDCSNEAFAYLDGKQAADRRRAVPDPAHRLRRRGRLRDPLPRRLRRARVGRADGRRQAARAAALRARAPADPAPAEDAHPRRPGHRFGVDAVRRRDAVDRQARQGAGLHRQVGARSTTPTQTPTTALVGFTLSNGDVPTEGAVVVDANGTPAGQVTSARHSPVLGRTIGMAWVPDELAHDGATITISDEGRTLTAEIQTKPFYDPDGEVLRS